MILGARIKIAFFGSSEFSLVVLKELKKNGVIPDLVVTTPDKPQGRKMILTPTLTKVWSEENSVEYAEPGRLNDEAFLKKIKNYNLFVVASYGKIIPKIILDIPKYKVLNIHPSFLPKYRGPSPLQGQILNDEKNIGVSIMLIDEQIDHGAIVAQKMVEISNWPVGYLKFEAILAKEGADLLAQILPGWISGKIKSSTQNDKEATFTKKVLKTDGLLSLLNDAYKNYLKILAYEEWPKTYFEVDKKGQKIRVIIKKATWKNGSLQIESVLPEGKKEMSYSDFLRGL